MFDPHRPYQLIRSPGKKGREIPRSGAHFVRIFYHTGRVKRAGRACASRASGKLSGQWKTREPSLAKTS